MLRAILIFPEFPNPHSITAMRAKYDPLVNRISPHVTLVFPFESDVSTETLAAHLKEATVGLTPFRMVLRGVTGADGDYLLMNVKVGNDQIIQLHDRLYTGPLQQYLDRSLTYVPHLTVGRLKDKPAFELALAEVEDWNERFETTVHEVVVENIDEHGNSIAEMKLQLRPI